MKLKPKGFLPSKRLGQNFLVDSGVLQKVVLAADLKPSDTIIEIGPGTGNLTRALAEKVKEVIAVEKDPRLVEILQAEFKGSSTVSIILGDALGFNFTELISDRPYKVVANLPFYLTAPLIRIFLERESPPLDLTLIIQKEVAQRICAKVPRMNLLATAVQFYALPEIITYIPRNAFWPKPKIDSAIIKIKPLEKRTIDPNLFFKIIKAGYQQPRKQVINNLSRGLNLDKNLVSSWLLENNLEPEQRAATISLSDWLNLTKSFIIK